MGSPLKRYFASSVPPLHCHACGLPHAICVPALLMPLTQQSHLSCLCQRTLVHGNVAAADDKGEPRDRTADNCDADVWRLREPSESDTESITHADERILCLQVRMSPDNMIAYVLWNCLPDHADAARQTVQRRCATIWQETYSNLTTGLKTVSLCMVKEHAKCPP